MMILTIAGDYQVLDVEFSNVKALYRRAQAYMETADLHLAELDIKKALETEPENRFTCCWLSESVPLEFSLLYLLFSFG